MPYIIVNSFRVIVVVLFVANEFVKTFGRDFWQRFVRRGRVELPITQLHKLQFSCSFNFASFCFVFYLAFLF